MISRRPFLILVFSLGIGYPILAQHAVQPPLVVVITIDQVPYEYLARFGGQFGRGGFRRLMEQGASFTNASYKHAINLTGPGHAVILSGAYGNQNGIIANNWIDVQSRASVYCVEDKDVALLGASGAGRSPANFIGTTYGDELRLASGFRSKVIAISHKDRAAILLGGKMANAAFWMADSSFVTSSYYTATLPAWVREFNSSGLVNSYFGRMWTRRLPEAAFNGLDVDDAPYESGGNGLGRTFPHPITGGNPDHRTPSYYHALMTSPFADEILASFAKAAVRAEQLGERGVTDLLCISFSANDYVGHSFGPHSREVLEMSVATDSIIADFLGFLDERFGAGNCLVALTSDHGIAPMPEYIRAHHPGAETGRVPPDSITGRCEWALSARFGSPSAPWIERSVDHNIHLRRATLGSKQVSPEDAARVAGDALLGLRGVAAVYTREHMESATGYSVLDLKVAHSYHPLRSGDLFYVLKPYYFEGTGGEGTTHGEPYDYSAHVPLILMGRGLKPGAYAGEASPADLGPTLAAITGVEFPAGREGRVLIEALR